MILLLLLYCFETPFIFFAFSSNGFLYSSRKLIRDFRSFVPVCHFIALFMEKNTFYSLHCLSNVVPKYGNK